jgi:hypothetical protein
MSAIKGTGWGMDMHRQIEARCDGEKFGTYIHDSLPFVGKFPYSRLGT